MTTGAARLTDAIVDRIERLAGTDLPVAEIWRRIGADAVKRGRVRPSYERIRQLVTESRARAAEAGPSTAEVLVEVAFRARPFDAILKHASGVGVPSLERR